MMYADEYRKHLAMLGMTINGARHLFGINVRTARRLAADTAGYLDVPRSIEVLLRILVKYNITPDEALLLSGYKPPSIWNEPDEPKESPQ